MSAARKMPNRDEIDKLVRTLFEAQFDDFTSESFFNAEGALECAQLAVMAALEKWSQPPAPDAEEVEKLRAERDEARALKVPPSVDELLLAHMDAKVARTELAAHKEAVERLIEAAELAAGHLCRVAQRATDVGSKRHAQIRADDLTKALAAVRAAQKGERACRWTADFNETWETECGKAFVMIEGKPTDNDMVFCCYCGGRIEQVDFHDPDAPAPVEGTGE